MRLAWVEQAEYSSAVSTNGQTATTHIMQRGGGLLVGGALGRAANGFRFTCRQGERPSFDSSSVDRCELYFPQTYDRLTAVYDSEQLVIEPGPLSTAPWCALLQWHNTPDEGETGPSPPLSFSLDTADYLLVETCGETDDGTTRWTSPSPVTRGRPINIQTEATFDYAGAGKLKVTIDGQTVLSLSDIVMGYNDAVGVYRKCGIYRATSPETLVVQHWNIETRTGSSFSSRSTAPCSVAT